MKLKLLTGTAMLAMTLAAGGCGGIGLYAGKVVADHTPQDEPSTSRAGDGVRVTYLGTNGYLLASGDAAVLVDPYFTRIDLNEAAWDLPIAPDAERIDAGMGKLEANVDAILVTHGHMDHLMDVPEIARRTGAVVVASPTSCRLCEASGVAEEQLRPALPGDRLELAGGAVRVRVVAVEHPPVLGVRPPFPGTLDDTPDSPTRASDWILGTTLGFVIELGKQRIYVDAGGTPDVLPPTDAGPVDLAILGVAVPVCRDRFVAAVQRLRPRYVLPSHQDDLFRPLSKGFWFGPLSDFPAVLRAWRQADVPGRLILLDYFTPWTLR